MWWLVFPIAVAAFLLILIFRTLFFFPRPLMQREPSPAPIDADKAIRDLKDLVRLPTVSCRDKAQEDGAAFAALEALLCERYPLVHRTCRMEKVGDRALLYCWPGLDSGDCSVFAAHYDVVPADAGTWEHPPFSGDIADGCLWGRGTLDTKSTLLGILHAAETLIASGFVPAHDVYFAFAGDEEIMGHGAEQIVSLLDARGIRPQMVLDEGGAIVNNVFPGVKRPSALIGIAEKGSFNIVLSAESRGGHTSAPPAETPLDAVARAVTRIRRHPFHYQLTAPVLGVFGALDRQSNFFVRLVFANIRVFAPLLALISRQKGGEMNALLHTTVAFTMAEAGKNMNVLPTHAEVRGNMRLLGHDDKTRALRRLNRVIADPAVTVSGIDGGDPSPVSQTDCAAYRLLSAAITESFPGVLVSPYLMIACSDARHYHRICPAVYRFSGMELTNEDRRLIHGVNERIRLEKIVTTAQFYYHILHMM